MMMTKLARVLSLTLALALTGAAVGQGSGRVDARLALRDTPAISGETATLGVILDVDPRWHIQAGQGSGDEQPPYIATEIQLTLPDGWSAGKSIWPPAHVFPVGIEMVRGYEGVLLVAIPVTVADDAAPGKYTIEATIGYQACDDRACELPTDVHTDLVIEVAATRSPDAVSALSADDEALFTELLGERPEPGSGETIAPGGTGRSSAGSASEGVATVGAIAVLVLLAMLGGFLLNLTPCVLPVIPLKIMSLAQQAHGNRAKTLGLGVAMCAGIMAFWVCLGVAVASVTNFTTNELFQYPAFPITVGIVIVIMAVGMCGMFSVRLPQWVYRINPGHDSYHGSFGFGVMTAILSTPCTAPFMGSAIAASIGQPVLAVLSVFAGVGLGMALPYFILAARPQLVDRMPRTGPASELIKQVMGLLMLAAGAYFLGVGFSGLFAEFGEPPSRLYWWAVALFIAAAGGWMVIRTMGITRSNARRATFGGIGAALVAMSVFGARILTDKGPIPWMYYTPDRLQAELDAGQTVVLKFTAEWCANCHFLERTVINSDPVVEMLLRNDVTPMKVDITNKKAAGNELLTKYWRSIPYLVVERPDGSVAFEADWYTASDVVEGIESAVGQTEVAISESQASASFAPRFNLFAPLFHLNELLHPRPRWNTYTPQALQDAVDEEQIAVVYFGADWIAENYASRELLETDPESRRELRKRDVDLMYVDFTTGNPAGEALKTTLGGGGLPLLAVYGGALTQPIVHRGLMIDSSPILDALAQARGESTGN